MCKTPDLLTDPPYFSRAGKGSLFNVAGLKDSPLNILQDLRLTGGIFLDGDFTAPWCVLSKVGPEDCTQSSSKPSQLIAYHYVISGRLFLRVEGQAPIPIEGGEIVVLPHNTDHILGSAPDLPPVDAGPLVEPDTRGGLARILHGGGGERTHILCGYLGNEMPHSAVIAMLPSVLKINVAEGASGNWIESSFRFAAQELANAQTHSPAILARLAELLFMEAIRRYLDANMTARDALRDPLVGRALGIFHEQISRHWTTEQLAREIGLSRSAFAQRFTRTVGEPPMQYIKRIRLEQAAMQLRETSMPIPRIAANIGYESEAAFSRAFKQEYGTPPAAWRREKLQAE